MILKRLLRALLGPALCERCGLTWSPANASQSCPGCAYVPPPPPR